MKSYVFPYYVSFGKGDSVDGSIEYALSDKNAKRLEKSARFGGRFRLHEDNDIKDIYVKVFDAVIKQEKEVLQEDPCLVIERLGLPKRNVVTDKHLEEYLDSLDIGINYPEELQYLEKSIKDKTQSVCESVIIDRDSVITYLKDPENQNKIVYTDSGETLFFVPKKFAGKVIIPSCVRKIDYHAFHNCTKLRELIVEDGLSEIDEWRFEGCVSLEYVFLPSSIKKIGFNAFTKCENLKKIDLSEGLTEIDSSAFRFCSKLEELIIPSTVHEISAWISSYYGGFKKLVFNGKDTRINDERGGDLKGVTICALPRSKAKAFAKLHKLKFEELINKDVT